MLCGVGILSNALIYVVVFIPFLIFMYQSIVLAEEKFLRNKFGEQYNRYCSTVNRWVPGLRGLGNTSNSMQFKWRRWILKEYNTQYIRLSGITLITLFKYPELTNYDERVRD